MKRAGQRVRSWIAQGLRSATPELRRTIDESVNDELAVLLHQVVDITENATARKGALLAKVFSCVVTESAAAKQSEGGVGFGVVRTTC
jgi:hypothetical protein